MQSTPLAVRWSRASKPDGRIPSPWNKPSHCEFVNGSRPQLLAHRLANDLKLLFAHTDATRQFLSDAAGTARTWSCCWRRLATTRWSVSILFDNHTWRKKVSSLRNTELFWTPRAYLFDSMLYYKYYFLYGVVSLKCLSLKRIVA